MRTTVDYLDALKAKLGLPSDYAAAKLLGVTRSAASRYRTGVSTFDDEVAVRVAELLEINPLEVIFALRAERAANEDARTRWEGYWENFSQSFLSPVSRADARQLSLWPV
jgi:transcriptional regulator with XRE-family HTH domain